MQTFSESWKDTAPINTSNSQPADFECIMNKVNTAAINTSNTQPANFEVIMSISVL